jgi:serine/threonine-protein kinase
MTRLEIDVATWTLLNRLLDEALGRPASEREAWLEGLAPEYDPLKSRLRSLLGRGFTPTGESTLGTLPKLLGEAEGWLEPESAQGAEADLAPGDRLGRYEIRGLLGAGGMGRVYRAFEPELAREVAIKTMARALRGETSSLRRAEREARVLATLSHPNIGGIHGLERIDGAPYLILELVEGETLHERLRRGPLPLASAIAVALQLASALEEAHRKGVVHRDLKPANLKLVPDGRLKVLDFGIAKAADAAAQPADGVTATHTGLIRGTAPYMSPEQLRGEPADTRGDIWAFGCVFYEMLTGGRPFPGLSTAEVMASVLRDDVDWNRLPVETPPALRRLLRRCLVREKVDRLQDIGDARIELQELERGTGAELGAEARAGTAESGPRAGWRASLIGGGVAAVLAIAIAAALLPRSQVRAPGPVAHLGLELPPALVLEQDYAAPFAVTPNGRSLVVLARENGSVRLHLRELGSTRTRPLADTENAWLPFLSPDGREVAFFADRKLKRVPLEGGPALTLAEIGDNPRGGAWSEDGSIVLAPSINQGLSRVSAKGGEVAPLTRLDLPSGEASHRWPQVLPGGEWVIFTTGYEAASYDDAAIDAVSIATGARQRLVEGGSFGRYASGRLLFVQGGRLLAVPFDPKTVAVRGAPEPVLESVRYDPRNGSAHFALSPAGTFVYGRGVPSFLEHHLSWLDEGGRFTRIGGAPRRFREPQVSPDGRRVAVVIGPAADSDLWVVDTESSTFSRISFGLSPWRPVWRPDGQGITVGAKRGDRFELLTFPATGAGQPALVLEAENRVSPCDWSADGRLLVFQERRPETGWDLRVLEAVPAGAPPIVRDLAARPAREANADLSPDGRLLAYESDELDGVNETYLLPLADPGAYVRATTTATNKPRWGRGGELFYWVPPRVHPGHRRPSEGLHRVFVKAEGSRLTLGSPTPVWPETVRRPAFFDRLLVAPFAAFGLDSSRRTPRFLMLENPSPSLPPVSGGPIVVLNWLEELNALEKAPGPPRP